MPHTYTKEEMNYYYTEKNIKRSRYNKNQAKKKRLLDVKRQCQRPNSLPIFERMTVNLDDAVFDESFCSHQFIVAGVVDNINDSSFTADT